MQFGAPMDYLKLNNMYENTFVVLMNDHGMEAKGLLYEQGTRIMNFMHYPELFNIDPSEGPHLMPKDWIASNVDVVATVLDLAGVSLPEGYQMEGVSYVDDMLHHLDPDWAGHVEQGEGYDPHDTNQYQIIDVMNSNSIVTDRYQYIWRANEIVDDLLDVDELYPNTYDLEQLYDLYADPSEKVNVATHHAYKDVVTCFEEQMRDYIDSICISADGVCSQIA